MLKRIMLIIKKFFLWSQIIKDSLYIIMIQYDLKLQHTMSKQDFYLSFSVS